VARSSANILALAAAIGLLYYGRVFFITVIIAAMIAMLLDPAVDLFVKLRLPRGAGSFAVCSLALMFLYLAGVGAYTQLIAMIDDLPAYSSRINELVDNAAARVDRVEQGVYRTLIPKRFQDQAPAPDAALTAAARGKRKRVGRGSRGSRPSFPKSRRTRPFRRCASGRNPPLWSPTFPTISGRSTTCC
jgi:predicted PurR-regulated permease PerM